MGRRRHSKKHSTRRRSQSSGGSVDLDTINLDQFTGGDSLPSVDALQQWKLSEAATPYKTIDPVNNTVSFKKDFTGLRLTLYTTPDCGMCAHFEMFVKPQLISSIQARYTAAVASLGDVNFVPPFVEFETKIILDDIHRPRNANGTYVNLPAVYFDLLDQNGNVVQNESQLFVPNRDYTNEVTLITPGPLLVSTAILAAAAGRYHKHRSDPFFDTFFSDLLN
jgi:hypothetical protein